MANESTFDLVEAAAFLRMSPAVLRQKARLGLVRGAKPGKGWVFLESDLVAFLRSLYSAHGQAPLSGCGRKEATAWHSINAAASGGPGSQHPMGSEYAALLGLETGDRQRQLKNGSKPNSGSESE